MRKKINKHKTTITAGITALLCVGAVIRWYMGQIDTNELQDFCTNAGVIATILIGFFSKDGEIKPTKGEDNV